MKAKRILSVIAIISILSFAVNATENHVGPNGEFDDDYEKVELATDNPFYEKADISNADAEHIATTAYVKGAYNDVIAALNKTSFDLADRKQEQLLKLSGEGYELLQLNHVIGQELFIDDYEAGVDSWAWDESLITAAAVAKGILSQRVKIYTTWDDDSSSATAEVPLITATAQ